MQLNEKNNPPSGDNHEFLLKNKCGSNKLFMKKQTRVHSPFPGSLKQILLEVDDTIAIIKKENVRTIGAVKQKQISLLS